MSALQQPTLREHEYDFTSKDFERVRKLIYKQAGISLSDSKREMVYSRLSRRLRALGLTRFDDYFHLLERGDDSNAGDEMQSFVNSLTTNLTSFFREAHHFSLLAEQLKILKGRERITLWCSAASTGEEPYSMAMTVAEQFGGYDTPVTILATDIDTNVLETARRGVYMQDRVEKMPPEQVRRFFLKGTGSQSGTVRVREELRNMVTFRRLNLLDDRWPVRGPFDAIFCRNVMIYFDKPTQYQILQKFAPLLHPEGLFYAGHSESFFHAADLFKLRGKTVYELAAKSQAKVA